MGILQSALKYGFAIFYEIMQRVLIIIFSTSVKRIVVTSSCASVFSVASEPKIFNEKDWNKGASEAVKEQGKNASPAAKYMASKTLAEKGMFVACERGRYWRNIEHCSRLGVRREE